MARKENKAVLNGINELFGEVEQRYNKMIDGIDYTIREIQRIKSEYQIKNGRI